MHKSILFATVAAIATVGPLTDLQAAGSSTPAPAVPPPAAPPPAANPLAGRSATATLPPILQVLRNQGNKITALGDAHGQPSYLVEDTATGKVQVISLSTDGAAIMIGPMQELASDGISFQSVTLRQLADMQKRFEAGRAEVEAQQRRADEERRKADAAARALEAQGTQAAEAMRQYNATLGLGVGGIPAPASSPAPTPQARPGMATPVLPGAAPAVPGNQRSDAAPVTNDRYLSTRDTQTMTAALETTAFFPVGRPNVPVVYMVADPQCPHCHEAWKVLRPRIEAGTLTVRVILVAGLPGSDRLAVSLLGRDNPGRAFFEGEGSVQGVPIAPVLNQDQARTGQGFLDVNMAFLRQADIRGTPWMAYVGKDGKLREMSGDTAIPDFLGAL